MIYFDCVLARSGLLEAGMALMQGSGTGVELVDVTARGMVAEPAEGCCICMSNGDHTQKDQ